MCPRLQTEKGLKSESKYVENLDTGNFHAATHFRGESTYFLSCENCGQDFDMKKQLTKHKKTCPLTNCVNVIQKSPHSESSKASVSGKLTN